MLAFSNLLFNDKEINHFSFSRITDNLDFFTILNFESKMISLIKNNIVGQESSYVSPPLWQFKNLYFTLIFFSIQRRWRSSNDENSKSYINISFLKIFPRINPIEKYKGCVTGVNFNQFGWNLGEFIFFGFWDEIRGQEQKKYDFEQ